MEQYFKTVLAANLSTSLPACSSKLEEFSKQDLLLMHLQATERSIQTSEQVWHLKTVLKHVTNLHCPFSRLSLLRYRCWRLGGVTWKAGAGGSDVWLEWWATKDELPMSSCVIFGIIKLGGTTDGCVGTGNGLWLAGATTCKLSGMEWSMSGKGFPSFSIATVTNSFGGSLGATDDMDDAFDDGGRNNHSWSDHG